MTTKLERISELSNQEVKVEYGYSNDRLTRITHNGFNYGFGYDEFGKTRLVAIAGSSVVSYEYEEKNGKLLNKTITYYYDEGGNLREEREYDYTTGTVSGTPKKYTATVMDEKWKDKLLKWGSTEMTYDACGNMQYQFRTAAKGKRTD